MVALTLAATDVGAASPFFVQAVLVPIIVAILSGSGGLAIAGWLRDRRDRKAAPDKPKLEQDALRLGNESIAVVSMERALNAAHTRITDLEARLTKAEKREQQLERQLRRREDEVDNLRHRLRDLGQDV